MRGRRMTALLTLSLAGAVAGCGDSGTPSDARATSGGGGSGNLGAYGAVTQLAADRDLTPDDVTAALKTYMPSGRYDDYLMFASGGHGGQVLVIGMPSMRILRIIGVFTPGGSIF